ncbi:MAG: dihydroorotase [Clostridia bacterium]|nr:dihydroorotase [Clostridia bacterium]
MNFVLKNAKVYRKGKFIKGDILVKDGRLNHLFGFSSVPCDAVVYDAENCIIIPGLVDVHVHLREPGFSFKETVKSGTLAAAHGGYTHVCSMPNLNPVPDNLKNLKQQLDIIKNDAVIKVTPYGSITVGQMGDEISDMDDMKDLVAGFSDDGKGVQEAEMMIMAMEVANACGKMIVAHCEDNSLLHGGYIHDGEYARIHGHRGICSESEYLPIKRDIPLAKRTGCGYHVCHISTKESVEIIRQAKKDGVNISCETAPHYLVLNDMDLQEDGRFKMNPPIRSEEDRLALIEGIKDGTIEMIATDHAPHTAEEKGRGLEKSLMGVVGLETAFPVLWTELVMKNIISAEQLVKIMSINPAKRFGFESGLDNGKIADFAVFDVSEEYEINPEDFLSMGRATPFEGRKVYGKCLMTVCGGEIVYSDIERRKENATDSI